MESTFQRYVISVKMDFLAHVRLSVFEEALMESLRDLEDR